MARVYRADAFEWIPKNLKPNSIDLIIIDPPYGNIVKEKWDKEWTMEDQWKMTYLIAKYLKPRGTAYVWGGIGKPYNRLFFEWLSKLEDRGARFASDEGLGLIAWDVITWSKKRAYGCKNRFLFTREECAMLVKGTDKEGPATFNIPLLDKLRGYAGYSEKYPAKSDYLRVTNVWTDVTELMRGKIHPTEKPSALAERMIQTSSKVGDLVVDFFAGSGSTGVAANRLGRRCILVEKSDCVMHVVDEVPRRVKSA